MTRNMIDPTLPVVDENGVTIYSVEYRDLDTKTLTRVDFGTELDAVRAVGAWELYANTDVVGHGPNVNRDNFRL